MSNVNKSAIDLRATLSGIPNGKPTAPWQQFNLGAGNAALTGFTLPKGWKPLSVHKAGLTQTEGSGNDYTVTYDGFVYSILFAVAPASGNVILADAWRV